MHIPSLFLSLTLLPVISYVSASQEHQIVMNHQGSPEYVPQTTSQPTLADLLTIEPSAAIFYSYARELQLSATLSDHTSKLTLFVPTNKAIIALARKPHEGPVMDGEIELSEEQFDRQAKQHVERWVSAHIVPEFPLSLSNEHNTLLEDKSISFKPISKSGSDGAEWTRVTLDNSVKIIAKKEGLNGDLYLIDGTLLMD